MKSVDPSGIHIVSFDVPYPYNYGGVIDVYHRCKALKENGVRVILHCFEYGRGKQEVLLEVADEVFYYKRDTNPFLVLLPIPFIVRSRASQELLRNLKKDTYPILFEGIHTCAFLGHRALSSRWVGVRAHNIEHDYYAELAKIEPNWKKRLFFKLEAFKLKKFESVFQFADEILSVTRKDNDYFQKTYAKGVYVPVFNPLNWGEGERGTGDYALFHGNLTVVENVNAVQYLIDEVWEKDCGLRLVIAGKEPSFELVSWLIDRNVTCIASPSNEELNVLIREAKINLLPTFQATGIKHKLLNALANGGYCLANTPMVEGTGLDKMVILANSVSEWKDAIRNLAVLPNDSSAFEQRTQQLRAIFDMQKNAELIMELAQVKQA